MRGKIGSTVDPFIHGHIRAYLKYIADKRHAIRKNDPHNRILTPSYEYEGLCGEWKFGEIIGQFPNLSLKLQGDKGRDFSVFIRSTLFHCNYFSAGIDVKTTKTSYLMHEQGCSFTDIYVVMRFKPIVKKVFPLGWEWGGNLKKVDPKDVCGTGVINHYISVDKLLPMRNLYDIMMLP